MTVIFQNNNFITPQQYLSHYNRNFFHSALKSNYVDPPPTTSWDSNSMNATWTEK